MTDITSHLINRPHEVLPDKMIEKSARTLTSDSAMRAASVKFEATFLAEMLKHTGLGEMPEGFNGGAGEAAFSDFLVHEYAEAIASKRSTGLADQIYRAMKERSQQ